MSLDASIWAWSRRVSKSTSKLVLLALADRAGADHTSFPTVETLSNDTELNRKTIISAIQHLQELGLIKDTGLRKGATRKVVVYELIGVACRHKNTETVPKSEPLKGAKKITKKQSQKRNHSKSGIVPFLDGNSPENGTLNSPENGTQNLSVNQSRNSNKNIYTKNPGKTELDYTVWPSMPSDQTMRDWVAMRRRFKADVSQTVINAFAVEFRKAETFGFSVDECLSEAVTRNWRGFKVEWLMNAGVQPRQRATKQSAATLGFTASDYNNGINPDGSF